VPEDERASEPAVNDLVQEHVDGQDRADVLALAANIAESLVDLILLAPEQERNCWRLALAEPRPMRAPGCSSTYWRIIS
jgi:hypothetical protein